MSYSSDITVRRRGNRRRLELIACIIGPTKLALPSDLVFLILEMANLVQLGRHSCRFTLNVKRSGRIYYRDINASQNKEEMY